MLISEFHQLISASFPPSTAESYDNVGLICGNPNLVITKLLCCLDCTEAVVEEALSKGCNLILAHHPIILGGLTSLTGRNYVERTVIKAIKNDISIYAAHTNLDNAFYGVNLKIAEKLGLTSTRILQPMGNNLLKLVVFVPIANVEAVRNAIFNAGGGHIGEYDHCSFNIEGQGTFRGSEKTNPYVGIAGSDHQEDEVRVETIVPIHLKTQVISAMIASHPYEEVAYDLYPLSNLNQRLGSGMIGELNPKMTEGELLKFVADKMKCEVFRHTELTKKTVQRVAVCGGAGRFLLKDAMAQKADVFITSDFKYHDFFDAESKILILDIGHFESEQFTPELMKDFLVNKNVTFAVLLSEVKTNPVQYFISK